MTKKILITSFFFVILCLGLCYGEEYVSKTNSNHRIYYLSMPYGHTTRSYKDYSRENPDTIYRGISDYLFYKEEHYYLNGEIVDLRMDQFAAELYYKNMDRQKVPMKGRVLYTAVITSIWLAVASLIVFGIIGIRKGLRNEAVFFVSWADAIFTILSLLIFYGMFLYTPFLMNGGIFVVLLLFFGYHIFISIKSNVPFTNKRGMFCVFTGRLLMIFIGIMAVALVSGGSNKRGRRAIPNEATNLILSLAVIGIMAGFLKRLVNKTEVEDRYLVGVLR